MIRRLKYFLIPLPIALICWLAGAFVSLEPNMFQWHWVGRHFYISTVLISLICATILFFQKGDTK